MGDSRRFDLFAKLIYRNFPPDEFEKIADVAGGKGYLQTALRELGYDVTTFDKRKGRRDRPGRFQYKYQYFDSNVIECFDLLVGMHPDEATDHIIVEATKRAIPFVVCPCCVKPDAVLYWGDHNFSAWLTHLKYLANSFDLTETTLPMNGKSTCLIGKPKK